MDTLPDEKILEICNKLEDSDLYNFVLTHREGYRVCQEILNKSISEEIRKVKKYLIKNYSMTYYKSFPDPPLDDKQYYCWKSQINVHMR